MTAANSLRFAALAVCLVVCGTPAGADPPRLTYGPQYLPGQVELSKEEVEGIRASVSKQMTAYHDGLAEQNRVAGAKHQLWLEDAKRSHENDQWSRLHTQAVLSRHAFFSMFIFWVVISIVAIALGLTIYQFMKDSANAEMIMRKLLRRPPAPPQVQARDANADALKVKAAVAAATAALPSADADETALAIYKLLRAEQKFSLGPSGLQLGTQLVGLVMLGFAMGFFYLYLEKVYPITVAQPRPPSISASASQR